MLKVVDDVAHDREEVVAGLDEIAREGARRMLAAALRAEADAYVDALAEELDEAGRRLVVRNGHARAREVTTVAGALEVRAPRVNDKRVDPRPGSAGSSPARFCRRGVGAARRSARSCRCCTCVG
jgi:transposase-like protein